MRPDMILMDLLMPKVTGFDAVREMRQMPALKEVPIIAMSASAFPEDCHRAILVGCNAFLPKTIQIEELLGLLAKHLGLTWVYAQEPMIPSLQAPETVSAGGPLEPPPPEQMRVLYDLAMAGDIAGIEEQARLIEQLDTRYIPFASRLRELAKGFQDTQIVAFIQQYLAAEAPR